MICEACGKVAKPLSPALEAAIAALAGDKAFAQRRIIELVGLCADLPANGHAGA
jgi:hypothetical protein